MPDVLLATGAEHPELWEDELLLVEALAERGLSVRPGVWSDPAVDWAAARLVVIRSAFDYIRDRDAFCAWADRVEATTPLHNAARVLRWNSHKSYLRELEAAGVPIVPTAWIDAGSRADLAGLLAERSWRDAVVKPAVDNGARGALRVHAADPEEGQSHLDLLLAERDVMIQPFVAATETSGERAMIHIDGRFSHAIRKDQMLAGRAFSLDRTPPIHPEPAELALAEQVLSLIPESPLLYARVDAVMDEDVARLMELEMIEPVLFFSKAPGSAERMADAIAERL
jgi:glutathione synthase/RimK-type ligase-like ATP-grasp enzyme